MPPLFGGADVKKIKSYLTILTGITLSAIATGLLYIPNEIVTGGISGIATILYPLGIPPGAVYLVLNLLLLVFSYKILGREFVIHSVFSVVVLSLLVQVFSDIPPITENVFLATLFGSFLFGLGAALTFIENANTGGTDIIGRLLQAKYSHLPIGTLLLITDGIIIFVSLLISGNIDLTLYGLFGLFISTLVINLVIGHLNSSKLALVITEKGDALSRLITENSRRGVTVLNARGAYSHARKNLLICALKNKEIPEFQKMVDEADMSAFTIFLKSEKIFGLGFYVYK